MFFKLLQIEKKDFHEIEILNSTQISEIKILNFLSQQRNHFPEEQMIL
jgi:hypothetical protein